MVVGLLLALLAASAPSAGALHHGHALSSVSVAEHTQQDPQPAAGLPASSPVAIGTSAGPAPLPGPTASPLPTAGESRSSGPAPAGAINPRVVYLTFDDGPDPEWTPQILALLARYDVRATFFEIGQEVRRHPHTAAAVRAAGQAVGSHTMHHRKLTKLSGATLAGELDAGLPGVSCLRPPFGVVDAHVRAAAAARGLRIVLWNVDTDDWARPGAKSIEKELLKHAKPGRTVLMHDGGGDRSQTLAALKVVLPQLVARGYRFGSFPGC
ncbi:polysaccharide deacetylase family protein [Angustibacter sp. McL0619]|uniref:polysaccharide deacetylase family protein n=1 Tax=Angustibacter sp. McL0619 TaxID=3415676 RepID=UPI003CF9C67A